MDMNQPPAWSANSHRPFMHSRRDFLYSGAAGALGLTLGDLLSLRAAEAESSAPLVAKADSLIHIFLPGGAAAQELWDPKPLAPSEYRGPLSTVQTNIPGVAFSQYLSKTAQVADRMTIVRSMTHGEAAHERGVHNMFTGYRPSPALLYPSIGSVVSHELGSRNQLPPYVCVPNIPNESAGTGYLSTSFGPFGLGSDPAANGFKVRDLSLPPTVSDERFDRRRSMLETVDAHFRNVEKSDAIHAMDSFYQAAYGLISSKSAREAFDLAAEPAAIRDEYGRHEAGQRCLMARRLVEGGVRMVSVTFGGWDHHTNIAKNMERNAVPFDQALAALIRDLERRGMLERTLVMVSSEFGRTPKINKDAGRDHWPRVFSVAFAGGGFKRGLVYGSSDAICAEPENNPLTIENMAATVYNQLGIKHDKPLMAPGNRPVAIVKNGEVVSDLVA